MDFPSFHMLASEVLSQVQLQQGAFLADKLEEGKKE